jgi:hypothetical protein
MTFILLCYYNIILLGGQEMAKAFLKTRSGMTISLEGSKKEVADIIKVVKEREEVSTRRHKKGAKKQEKPEQAKFTATDAILRLKEEGFFNKPMTLLDIKRALEEQGLIYPVTSLSGIMLIQVRKRNFRRIKENKIWTYVRGVKP